MYAVDAQTGNEKWRLTGHAVSSSGRVRGPSTGADKYLHAVDSQPARRSGTSRAQSSGRRRLSLTGGHVGSYDSWCAPSTHRQASKYSSRGGVVSSPAVSVGQPTWGATTRSLRARRAERTAEVEVQDRGVIWCSGHLRQPGYIAAPTPIRRRFAVRPGQWKPGRWRSLGFTAVAGGTAYTGSLTLSTR
jgi:hypothetical protein